MASRHVCSRPAEIGVLGKIGKREPSGSPGAWTESPIGWTVVWPSRPSNGILCPQALAERDPNAYTGVLCPLHISRNVSSHESSCQRQANLRELQGRSPSRHRLRRVQQPPTQATARLTIACLLCKHSPAAAELPLAFFGGAGVVERAGCD